jgi:hypothetical protein
VTDPTLPCSDEEWAASVDALNVARAGLELAQRVFDAAQVRVRDNLISQGVVPGELPS